jgi:hypothetical protein
MEVWSIAILLLLLLVVLDLVFYGLPEPAVEVRVHTSTLPTGSRVVEGRA